MYSKCHVAFQALKEKRTLEKKNGPRQTVAFLSNYLLSATGFVPHSPLRSAETFLLSPMLNTSQTNEVNKTLFSLWYLPPSHRAPFSKPSKVRTIILLKSLGKPSLPPDLYATLYLKELLPSCTAITPQPSNSFTKTYFFSCKVFPLHI